jgi:hypothetical protein
VKIGPLEISWRWKMTQREYDSAIVKGVFLALMDERPGVMTTTVRERIGKAARAEVKDFLEDRAERDQWTPIPGGLLNALNDQRDGLQRLAKDHRDLLLLFRDKGDPLIAYRIHCDSRCQKETVPHVRTADCRSQDRRGNREASEASDA